MSAQMNIQLIKDAYAAVDRREITELLSLLSDSIDWLTHGADELPSGGRHVGHTEVRRFIEVVGETWEFAQFEPRQIVAQADTVVVLGFYRGNSKGTGREFSAEFAHVFTIRNGKIARFREYTDTAALLRAESATPALP